MSGDSRAPEGQPSPRYEAVRRAVSRSLAASSAARSAGGPQAPATPATRAAFEELSSSLGAGAKRPLWIDAGCGTGMGTISLAQRNPDRIVLGVDKSESRLGRGVRPAELPSNCHLVRAELGEFWRSCRAAGWRAQRQFLLYPNPWPKSAHLKRRWYAHDAFPDLLATSESVELRTNWRIYAEEFCCALEWATGCRAKVEVLPPDDPLTRFEAKYRASGHALWRVEVPVIAPLRPGLRST